MIINFGYVAIANKLKDSSPNKTVTLKNLQKLDRSLWERKLSQLAVENIENTIRILRYNKAYGIKLYRFTSKIIPLVTHEEFTEWKWKRELGGKFIELGNCVKDTGIRVSTHPDHFTLLNSPRKEVIESARRDLDYHCSMFELMGLGPEYKCVLHIGGMYKNKEDSIKRFYEGFLSLEDRIRNRIILENDDKVFNAEDVLKICQNLQIPMVLDIHHDRCNPSGNAIEDMIQDIFSTWIQEKYPPKIHLSSPKSTKEIRSHHDYINIEEFKGFLDVIKGKTGNFDAMVEAKMKDIAVFKLMEDIKVFKDIKVIADASVEV